MTAKDVACLGAITLSAAGFLVGRSVRRNRLALLLAIPGFVAMQVGLFLM